MENLIKNQESRGFFKYPKISFEAETGKCEISGESFMEDSRIFYNEIFDWLKEFNKENSSKTLEVEIRLIYFNTSSTKMLFEMLKLLEDFKNSGQEIIINWYYDEAEIELFSDIMDLCYDLEIEINVLPI